jgi:hypothetical protein
VSHYHQQSQPAFGAGPPTSTVLISGTSTGSSGNQSDYLDIVENRTVTTRECAYSVRVLFTATGSNLRLQKVRAEWSRQISPAPASASFTDVPTGYWAFQAVEALRDSGITTGCNPPSQTLFCPEDHVTRAQMATFLARALGLNWP